MVVNYIKQIRGLSCLLFILSLLLFCVVWSQDDEEKESEVTKLSNYETFFLTLFFHLIILVFVSFSCCIMRLLRMNMNKTNPLPGLANLLQYDIHS